MKGERKVLQKEEQKDRGESKERRNEGINEVLYRRDRKGQRKGRLEIYIKGGVQLE